MIVVCASESPRSAIISTRSRKLSLYRRYQRTQSTMISRSKWRPLKRSSTFNMLGQVHRGLICRRICATPTLRTRTLVYPQLSIPPSMSKNCCAHGRADEGTSSCWTLSDLDDHRLDDGCRTMDVGSWLRSLGLGQYEAAFRESSIDGQVLPHLTLEDLKEFGVRRVQIGASCSMRLRVESRQRHCLALPLPEVLG